MDAPWDPLNPFATHSVFITYDNWDKGRNDAVDELTEYADCYGFDLENIIIEKGRVTIHYLQSFSREATIEEMIAWVRYALPAPKDHDIVDVRIEKLPVLERGGIWRNVGWKKRR